MENPRVGDRDEQGRGHEHQNKSEASQSTGPVGLQMSATVPKPGSKKPHGNRPWIGLGGALIAAGGAYLGWQWYKSWEATYSEQPPRKATIVAFEPRRSTIQPNLMLPYEALRDAANKAVDKFAQPASGRANIDCKRVEFLGATLFSGCLDADWSLNASRNGSIEVAKAGDGIAVSIPVQFSGKAGLNGAIADALSLGGKNFSGSFVAGISGKVVLDERFCPKIINPSANFSWTSPASFQLIGRSCAGVGRGLEVCVGPWDLPIGSLLTPTIRDKIGEQVADINSKLPCDPVRTQLAKVWQKQSFPITAPKLPPMFVNVTPRALSSPGLIADDKGVRLVARLDADVGVSTQKGEAGSAGEIPPNQPIADPAGKLSIALPIAADYPTLNKIVNEQLKTQLAKTPIVTDTPAGKVKVDVSGVEIYPSGDRLAIGAKFKADVPGRIFNANGTVWLTTLPVPAADGRSLKFSELKLTRVIDNELWSLLTAALNTQLVKSLSENSNLDFGKDIDIAVANARTILADPKQTSGVVVNVKKVDAKLGRVVPAEQNLVVEGLLDVEADAEMPSIPF
jgi:hypothetical protein